MKTLRIFGMVLFAVLMCVNFASCSNEEEFNIQKKKEYTISLNCVGEILNIEQNVESRNAETKVITITVLKSDGKRYARGSFDLTEAINVKLLDGEIYTFKANYVPDNSGTATNEFEYPNDTEQYAFPWKYYESDWYWGFYSDYTPSKDNDVINIHLKRMSFSVKFIAEGLHEEATLKVRLEECQANTSDQNLHILTNSNNTSESFYTFPRNNFEDVYTGILENEEYVNYYCTTNITVELTRTDGVKVALGSFPITVERNKRTTVVLKLKDSDITTEKGFNITIDESDLEDGSQFEIDGDEGTVTEKDIIIN